MATLAVAVLAGFAPTAHAARNQPLDSYLVTVKNAAQMEKLATAGFDVTEGVSDGAVAVVATGEQAARLRSQGFSVKLLRDDEGRTDRQRATAQSQEGYTVWRPYNAPAFNKAHQPVDNLRTELEKLAAANPGIVELEHIGRSIKNVPIIALKVTKNAQTTPDGQRPAVLYSATQHAREWLAPEIHRRTLRLFVDNYGKTGPAIGTDGQPVEGVDAEEITQLVNTRELWFVIVCNPDGYDYTFVSPDTRLWRKNLRDNDGDGEISPYDGVDPNRNFPTRWKWDDEGSSSDPASETYRGTGPASEPETKALDGLMKKVGFEMNSNYHTFGQLLLYPFGWQQDLHAADDPLFRALSGTDQNPAIPEFNPGVGAELYITNGDTNDHAYSAHGTLSWTPEGTGGDPDKSGHASGFVFQDVEADVQAEFERNLPFHLDLARSADDPADPESHLGNEAPDFEIESFPVSYGNPQVVQVVAKRKLGPVTIHWQIGNGDEQSGPTIEWKGGEVYGREGDVYYHWLRGTVTGTRPGDSVKVWFEAGAGKKSESFTYTVVGDSNAPVLIVNQENYTAGAPFYADRTKPAFQRYYEETLETLRIPYDVYDVDANDVTSPHWLGVLSHYRAVVWYTGNDYLLRRPGQPGGTGGAQAMHEITMDMRDYLNEGGKVFLSGRNSGRGYYDGVFEYSPTGEPALSPSGWCNTVNPEVIDHCNLLSNDFHQYWMGGFIYVPNGGVGADGNPFSLRLLDPLGNLAVKLNGGDSANNQGSTESDPDGAGSALVTSSILPIPEYPQHASFLGARWNRPGASPYDPFAGSYYLYSGQADRAYKRFGRTVDLSGKTGSKLDFQASWDTEIDWDYWFVEVHDVAAGTWDTVPLTSGGETISTTDTGHSCEPAEGNVWHELHPFLEHYQTDDGAGKCEPTGTTGDWNAVTGNGGGWQHVTADLSAYDGKNVEVYISSASDWATQGLGVFIDEVRISSNQGTIAQTGFETADLGGFAVVGSPEGSSEPSNTWSRTQKAFDEGPVVRRADSVWATFGLEGVDGVEQRTALMSSVMRYFGVLGPGAGPPIGGGGGGGATGPRPGGGATVPSTSGTLRVRLLSRFVRRDRRVRVRVSCPASFGNRCRGQLRLTAGSRIYGSRSFSIAANRNTVMRTRLTRGAYRTLRRKGRLRARLTVLTRGQDGVLRRAEGRFTFRPRR